MNSSSTQQSISAASNASTEAMPHNAVTKLGNYAGVKRLLDFLVSAGLLIFLGPFMLLLIVLVKLDSRGPAIFRQVRVGKSGIPFVLYKYRTMVTDAPILTTEAMKAETRSYYTKLGLLLRRLSLDELPQLVNVFIGDMSIIGPRPSLESQQWLNDQRTASSVYDLRPGITGWAQVCGRDDLTDVEKVAFDAEYRKLCSPGLDARIALMTLKAVVTGDGAN